MLEGYDIDGVIYLGLPDDEVLRRVLGRRLCSRCGMDYNLIDDRPTVEGRCDVCGGELTTREDDTEEALATRLREYHAKTNPVLDLFRRLSTIDLKASLFPGQKGSLKVRVDGTVLDGRHRLSVLVERGEDIDQLPREIIERSRGT